MKKMTLTAAKKALKGDYISALSFFAGYLAQFEDEDEMEDALFDLDEMVFEKTFDWELSDEYLRVYTALRTAI